MITEEFFDIVDENNIPLDFSKSRKEVHDALQYWHRATHIWIVNNKNQILCQQRSLSKDANPGKWQSFFGGHLKTGQTYLDNAVEELSEELGLLIKPKELIPIHILKSDKAKHFGQVFVLW
jgi:isopentenyldiphosphate isomerase